MADWRRAGRAAELAAASQRGAAGGTVAGPGGDPGGPRDGHSPVPHRDRAEDPQPGVGLLAPEPGQPAQGVDTPADTLARARVPASLAVSQSLPATYSLRYAIDTCAHREGYSGGCVEVQGDYG